MAGLVPNYRIRLYARLALAAVRLFNGGVALLSPNLLGRRLGVNTSSSPGFGYASRLFGIDPDCPVGDRPPPRRR